MDHLFICVRAVRHNGTLYSEGNQIEMPEAEAEQLVRSGTLHPIERVAEDKDQAVPAIIGAIAKLTEGDFGSSGAPNVKPLEKLLGFGVTAAERDRAWSLVGALRHLPEIGVADRAAMAGVINVADLTEAEFEALRELG